MTDISEPFNIEPLFAHIDDDIIKDLSLSNIHLRYLLDNERKTNKNLLSENFRLKNEIKIVNRKFKKQKYS